MNHTSSVLSTDISVSKHTHTCTDNNIFTSYIPSALVIYTGNHMMKVSNNSAHLKEW